MRNGKGASPRRRGLPALALVSALLVGVGDAPAAVAAGPHGSTGGRWALTFEDTFDGTALDAGKWSSGFGWGPRSRGDLGFCDPANNVVGGGVLVQRIERRAQGGKPFSVGCVNSRDKFSQLHGYWEARIQMPGCSGARGAFWAKPDDDSWPPDIGVTEVLGAERSRATMAAHWRAEDGSVAGRSGGHEDSDFSAGYHVFGVEWTAGELVWFVDGVERMRTSAGAPFLDDGGPFYTLVTTQVVDAASTCGEAAPASWQYVDWVRVWERAPGGDEGGKNGGDGGDSGGTAAGCRLPTEISHTPDGLPEASKEASGMVASKRHPGVGWLIRDSGHPASLYAFRLGAGPVDRIREIPVPGAENRDWEDLVYTLGPDGQARLWVIESGQSGGAKYLYEIAEPDPERDVAAVLLGRYRYAFPDRSWANTESAFAFAGRLVLVTKTSPGRVYHFDRPLRAWAHVPR